MFRGFFWNSIKVTVMVVAITMVVSVLAAFALARMKFWGSEFLATGIFLTYLVPDTLLFLPLYQIVGGLGLLDSTWGLVLVYPTLTVPFCTWIMIGYFASIPKELDEAALIDGANWAQMLWKIFIPVALPGIIAATIFAFTVSWAAFVYPTAFITRPDEMPLTIGVVSQLIRSVVDLPQPEGPTSTTNSWSAMSRSMPFTACTPPSYSLTIFLRVTCAIVNPW